MKQTDRRVIALIQARMSSTRLPGKVLRPMQGRPMLQLMIDRLWTSDLVEVAILTSADASDDPVADLGEQLGVPVVRGSLGDVLDRYIRALDELAPDVALRLTGDCPFADARLVDRAVAIFDETPMQGVPTVGICNHIPGAWNDPHGYVAEVFQPDALRWLAGLELDDQQREHVTLGFKRRDLYRPYSIFDRDYSEMRWTVDWEEDFRYMDRMFGDLGTDAEAEEAIAWSRKHPHPKSHGPYP